MQQDLLIRGYSPHTQRQYVATMADLVRYSKRPAEQLTLGHVRDYQLHLVRDRQVSYARFNVCVCAIRFFFTVTLQRPWDIRQIPLQRKSRKLPQVLSQSEVAQIFEVIGCFKHRVILMTIYAAGLRVSEALGLRLGDIDADRRVIRVDQGKRRKDRYVMLSPHLLAILRQYIDRYQPRDVLFPGQNPDRPLYPVSIRMVCSRAAKRAGIRKPVNPKAFRHAFATHLLEAGTNIRVIQMLLGHRSLRSTEIYTHVARTYLADTPSPLDALMATPAATDRS